MKRLVLLSTSIEGSPGHRLLDRLQKHLTLAVRQDDIDLVWYLLLQGTTRDASPRPAFARVVTQPHVVGLSRARNSLLELANASGDLRRDAAVGFPDDDAWHPPGMLAGVAQAFTDDAALDIWICRYASQPTSSKVAVRPASAADVVRNASSNTLFVRGNVARTVGTFDERFGLGSPLGGAEDLDYALRCRQNAHRVGYVDAALVGHRDKSPALRANYFLSSAVVLREHRRQPGIRVQYARKLAVGMVLLGQGKIGLAMLARALFDHPGRVSQRSEPEAVTRP